MWKILVVKGTYFVLLMYGSGHSQHQCHYYCIYFYYHIIILINTNIIIITVEV